MCMHTKIGQILKHGFSLSPCQPQNGRILTGEDSTIAKRCMYKNHTDLDLVGSRVPNQGLSPRIFLEGEGWCGSSEEGWGAQCNDHAVDAQRIKVCHPAFSLKVRGGAGLRRKVGGHNAMITLWMHREGSQCLLQEKGPTFTHAHWAVVCIHCLLQWW